MDAARSDAQTRPSLTSPKIIDPAHDANPDALWPYLWYERAYYVGVGFYTLGFSLRIEGTHNMPSRGPVLVIANHESFFDPWMVGMAVRRHVVFLARKTLFDNHFLCWLIGSLNAVPINQDGVGKEGIKTVLAQLRKERAVLVFPEGNRTEDGKMQALQPGIHLLVRKASAMIVPVGIAGAYDCYSRWQKFPRPAPLFWPGQKGIALSVGKPLDSQRFADMDRQQALAELTEHMREVRERAEKLRRK